MHKADGTMIREAFENVGLVLLIDVTFLRVQLIAIWTGIIYCWIKNVIFEKTKVLFAMENNLYL